MMMSFATTVPVGIVVGVLSFIGSFEGGLRPLHLYSGSQHLNYFNSRNENNARRYGSRLGRHAHLRSLRRDASRGFYHGPFVVEE